MVALMIVNALLRWLRKPAVLDYGAEARWVVNRLSSSDPDERVAAEQVLRKVAWSWDAYYEAPYVVALLGELMNVGDERVLPCLERLAHSTAADEPHRRVKDAALRCLPAARERAEQNRVLRDNERARALLLRTADQPPEASRDLLRPAHDN